jgi:hypothetical protein
MKCFVIMPFVKPFDDVYDAIKMAVAKAVAGETLTCWRLDEIRGAGRITDDLVAAIQHSDICIADLTGNNPNVLWEVGDEARNEGLNRFHVSRRPSETAEDGPQPCQSVSIGARLSRR